MFAMLRTTLDYLAGIWFYAIIAYAIIYLAMPGPPTWMLFVTLLFVSPIFIIVGTATYRIWANYFTNKQRG